MKIKYVIEVNLDVSEEGKKVVKTNILHFNNILFKRKHPCDMDHMIHALGTSVVNNIKGYHHFLLEVNVHKVKKHENDTFNFLSVDFSLLDNSTLDEYKELIRKELPSVISFKLRDFVRKMDDQLRNLNPKSEDIH